MLKLGDAAMDLEEFARRRDEELARAASARCDRSRLAHTELAGCFEAARLRLIAASDDPRVALRQALPTDVCGHQAEVR